MQVARHSGIRPPTNEHVPLFLKVKFTLSPPRILVYTSVMLGSHTCEGSRNFALLLIEVAGIPLIMRLFVGLAFIREGTTV